MRLLRHFFFFWKKKFCMRIQNLISNVSSQAVYSSHGHIELRSISTRREFFWCSTLTQSIGDLDLPLALVTSDCSGSRSPSKSRSSSKVSSKRSRCQSVGASGWRDRIRCSWSDCSWVFLLLSHLCTEACNTILADCALPFWRCPWCPAAHCPHHLHFAILLCCPDAWFRPGWPASSFQYPTPFVRYLPSRLGHVARFFCMSLMVCCTALSLLLSFSICPSRAHLSHLRIHWQEFFLFLKLRNSQFAAWTLPLPILWFHVPNLQSFNMLLFRDKWTPLLPQGIPVHFKRRLHKDKLQCTRLGFSFITSCQSHWDGVCVIAWSSFLSFVICASISLCFLSSCAASR